MNRCSLSVAVGLLVAVAAVGQADQPTVRVFILSGQSNAGGNGNGDQLTPAQRQTDPEVIISYGRGDWQTLAPRKLRKPKSKFGINNSIFGVELSFARAIKRAYPDDIIAICKVGIRGGTSIVAWEKHTDRPGWLEDLEKLGNADRAPLNLYATVIRDTRKGIETLRQRDDVGSVLLSGMLWCQTERDAGSVEFSKAYRQNLTNLINHVRADLDSPELPFLFFDQHVERKPGREHMKASLRAVDEQVPFTALVPNNDLPTYEGVHFDTQGIWELGERFARAFLAMPGAPASR